MSIGGECIPGNYPKMTHAPILLPNRWVDGWSTQNVVTEGPAGSPSRIQIQQNHFLAATGAQKLCPLRDSGTSHKHDLTRLQIWIIAQILLVEDYPIGSRNQPKTGCDIPKPIAKHPAPHQVPFRNGVMSPIPQ
jgi:hypothetical protein